MNAIHILTDLTLQMPSVGNFDLYTNAYDMCFFYLVCEAIGTAATPGLG
jgi:hypothetical protein